MRQTNDTSGNCYRRQVGKKGPKIGKIKRKVAKSKAATERAVRANELASHPIHARVHTVDEHERHRDGARGGDVIPVHLLAIG